MSVDVREVDTFLIKLSGLMDEGIRNHARPESFLAALQVCINGGLQQAKAAGKLDQSLEALKWANEDEPPP